MTAAVDICNTMQLEPVASLVQAAGIRYVLTEHLFYCHFVL